MKRYVLQFRDHDRDPWEVIPGQEYDTLEEAKAALSALPFLEDCRVAEAYVEVHYKAAASWEDVMSAKEKSALLQRGRESCLAPLERFFEKSLQKSEFGRAENWYHEYCGAAKMLERLGLISREEYRTLESKLFERFLSAKYPDFVYEEDIRP